MWKKDDAFEPNTPARPEPVTAIPTTSPAVPASAAPPVAERTVSTPKAQVERATIGRSISIKGEVTGDEDLLIQGRVEGSVDLKQHSVTIGREGEVKADLSGRVITIEGKVTGNMMAEEQVVLRSSAQVQGDIAAPRVVLEDGARFRGGVDMGEITQAPAPARPAAKVSQASTSPGGTIDVTPRKETLSTGDDDKGASTGKTDGARKPTEISA